LRIVSFEEEFSNVVECWAGDPKRIVVREVVQFIIGLERRHAHPIKGKKQHDDKEGKRDIDGH
jgi:hypothetical protein